jgi:hypothetical protein
MRTQVLAALAGAALLGGCYRMAVPEERSIQLTRATRQESLDVAGPRVDPRTRTGAVEAAGSIADLSEPRQAPSSEGNEPERQQAEDAPAFGGSGWPGR